MSPSASSPRSPRRVLVLGGGVAGVECLLGLSSLARDAYALRLLTRGTDFEYRPAWIGEPFGETHRSRYSLARIARDCGADLIRDEARRVDVAARVVETAGGERLPYDALLVTVGVAAAPPPAHTVLLDPSSGMLGRLVEDVEAGRVRDLAIFIPDGAHWVLPGYELALLLAHHARAIGVQVPGITILTAEEQPLGILGTHPSTVLAGTLAAAGVRVITGGGARVTPGPRLRIDAGEAGGFDVDEAVAIPRLRADLPEGLPAGQGGFLHVDLHGRVHGAPGVYAAGDCIDFPIKQGGLAAQQADAIVEHLAASAGIGVSATPWQPVLRARLLTGGSPLWVRRDLSAPPEEAKLAGHALWWPPEKIAGRWLSAYLQERDDAAAGTPHPPTRGLPAQPAGAGDVTPVGRDLDLLGPRRSAPPGP